MLYLGKSHNLWHRMALSLEQMAIEAGAGAQHKVKRDAADCYDFEPDNSGQRVCFLSNSIAPFVGSPLILMVALVSFITQPISSIAGNH